MDYQVLDNAALWALCVGFFSPPVISIIQQSTWSVRTQSLVAFGFYLAVAAVTAWVAGLFTPGDYVRLALLIFLTGASSYSALWKPTGASPAIERVTPPPS
jgi:Na+(H+)/acetate symporter ActP